MSLDDKVYAYISDRGGEISWSQGCGDLGISIDELKSSIERLKKAGRIEQMHRPNSLEPKNL